jgi:hypothetical protein
LGTGTVEEDRNSLKRRKQNMIEDILHQLLGVATIEQLQ